VRLRLPPPSPSASMPEPTSCASTMWPFRPGRSRWPPPCAGACPHAPATYHPEGHGKLVVRHTRFGGHRPGRRSGLLHPAADPGYARGADDHRTDRGHDRLRAGAMVRSSDCGMDVRSFLLRLHHHSGGAVPARDPSRADAGGSESPGFGQPAYGPCGGTGRFEFRPCPSRLGRPSGYRAGNGAQAPVRFRC